MKHVLLSFGFVLAAIGVCFVTADDKPKPAAPLKREGDKKDAKAQISAGKGAEKPAKVPTIQPAAAPSSPPEDAVRQTIAALSKAYHQHDGREFAAIFTADGEYVDEKGALFHGRQAIADEFATFFTANSGTSIELQILSVRTIAPNVIAADGSTRFMRAKNEAPISGRFKLVCVKDSGKWLVASLREIEPTGEIANHHEQVQQLEWLIGDWIDEGADARVFFTCRWDESGNFLLRDFSVHVAGQKAMTGTQRIGYDPVTGHLKTWIFDSAGGYSDGFFHREGESWVLQSSGVAADGRMASGTSVFTHIDRHRMSWEGVDRVLGGERIADIGKVMIVRKPPSPTAQAK